MRMRTIKPGFFQNDALAELDPLARLLFAGLWCYADREGRFEWRPKRIKAELLPYDSVNIELALEQLMHAGFIQRYDDYGLVVAFHEHQHPHPNEAPSTLPAPPSPVARHATARPATDQGVKPDAPCNVVAGQSLGCGIQEQSLGSGGVGENPFSAAADAAPSPAAPGTNGHGQKRAKPIRPADPEATEIAAGMAALIQTFDPERSPAGLRRVRSAASVEAIRRLIQVDRRAPGDVRDVLVWLFGGQPGDYQGTEKFDWRTVIQGGQSLRKSWDQLNHQFRTAVTEE